MNTNMPNSWLEEVENSNPVHAGKTKKKTIISGLILTFVLVGLWYGYFRLRPSPPPFAEYSINGAVSTIEAETGRIILTVPIISAYASGTYVDYEKKVITVSGDTVFVKSEFVNGNLVFSQAGFQDVVPGAQIIVYASVNPQNTELIPATRVEIVK